MTYILLYSSTTVIEKKVAMATGETNPGFDEFVNKEVHVPSKTA